MAAPILDQRDAAAFYVQALALARQYCPGWSGDWPEPPDPAQDAGLVLLKLFSVLAGYTAERVNQIPEQRRLAFFQFLGMQPRTPLAAQAALQFTLADGRPPRLVAAASAVLAAADQRIRFETAHDLLVLPAVLSAAFTLLPAQDAFIDVLPGLGGSSPAPAQAVFGAAAAGTALGHWFLLGDPQLFRPDPTVQHMSLRLSGAQLYPEYFSLWCDAGFAPLVTTLTSDPSGRQRHLQIDFATLPQAPAAAINRVQQALYRHDGLLSGFDAAPGDVAGELDYWLLVRPAPQVRIGAAQAGQLPVITGIECIVGGSRIQPTQAAFNQLVLDLGNGAAPFGPTPKKDDAFYLRCDSVLARTGALVTLDFVLGDVARAFPVTLYWQFWDGAQWQSLNQTSADVDRYRFSDSTDQLRGNCRSGPTAIGFQCPAIAEHTVAGAKGRWLRALIADGGYGASGGMIASPVSATIDAIPDEVLPATDKPGVIAYLNDKAGVNFAYRFDPAEYCPPFILSLQLRYSHSSLPRHYWSYNAFELTRFLRSPYKPLPSPMTALYLGFAAAPAALAGQTLQLFFDLEQDAAADAAALQWQYFDGQSWQALEVDDGSAGLSHSGIVGVPLPPALAAAYLFSQHACWLRIVQSGTTHPLRLRGIYPNAVMARNVTTLVEQVLGSSNGRPNQSMQLPGAPVTNELSLGVIEPAGLQPPPLPGARLGAAGSVAPAAAAPVLRAWRQVDNFAFSGPSDRVYTVDCENGRIAFGDGRNGMLPPRGLDNIVATRFEQTLGLPGNVPAHTLTLLRRGIGDIARVTNPAPASGGASPDSRATLGLSSPALVKAGGVAVDLADMAALAGACSAQVARARAVQDRNQHIRIAVLARSTAPIPYSSPALLRQVRDEVRRRCLAPLAARIEAHAPDFVAIAVSARLQSSLPPDARRAQVLRLAARLADFLHPAMGGQAGAGWPFGGAVRASAVAAFLRAQDGVDGILGLSLNGAENGDVDLLATQLPVAGACSVYLQPA